MEWAAVMMSVLGVIVLTAGCSESSSDTSPRIELLYFEGCPDTPTVRENLIAALDRMKLGSSLTQIDLVSLPKTDTLRGYGSPTILVNGRDLFGAPVSTSTSVSCRLYPGGPPTSEQIEQKLRAAIVGG